jgi:hypothetical protein
MRAVLESARFGAPGAPAFMLIECKLPAGSNEGYFDGRVEWVPGGSTAETQDDRGSSASLRKNE